MKISLKNCQSYNYPRKHCESISLYFAFLKNSLTCAHTKTSWYIMKHKKTGFTIEFYVMRMDYCSRTMQTCFWPAFAVVVFDWMSLNCCCDWAKGWLRKTRSRSRSSPHRSRGPWTIRRSTGHWNQKANMSLTVLDLSPTKSYHNMILEHLNFRLSWMY